MNIFCKLFLLDPLAINRKRVIRLQKKYNNQEDQFIPNLACGKFRDGWENRKHLCKGKHKWMNGGRKSHLK